MPSCGHLLVILQVPAPVFVQVYSEYLVHSAHYILDYSDLQPTVELVFRFKTGMNIQVPGTVQYCDTVSPTHTQGECAFGVVLQYGTSTV